MRVRRQCSEIDCRIRAAAHRARAGRRVKVCMLEQCCMARVIAVLTCQNSSRREAYASSRSTRTVYTVQLYSVHCTRCTLYTNGGYRRLDISRASSIYLLGKLGCWESWAAPSGRVGESWACWAAGRVGDLLRQCRLRARAVAEPRCVAVQWCAWFGCRR